MIGDLYGVSLCLLMPSVLYIGGFGELGELGEKEGVERKGGWALPQLFSFFPTIE